MDIALILAEAVEKKASDVFIVTGQPLSFKLNGEIVERVNERLLPDDTRDIIRQLYSLAGRPKFDWFIENGDDDFSFSIRNVGRFRINAYLQRGSMSSVIRVVPFGLPDPKSLGIPEAVMRLYQKTKGLVLVTGPAGSGKSTTLACLIDYINRARSGHILTLEDPIEYLHQHNKSIVSQREISMDTCNYVSALKAGLRQSPDVILIGEMRDLETIEIAMTAAETGHLVLSTLHTVGAANTINRIIDIFPAEQQRQIRVQLAMTLQAVVSQHLIPSEKSGRVAAFEVMVVNNAIRTLIRDSKLHQLDSIIFTGAEEGMVTMDSSLAKLCQAGLISKENAMMYASDMQVVARQLGIKA